MTMERLSEKFTGFDSFDEKMIRCPNDLNDDKIRIEYLYNHIQWFLKNHHDAIPLFLDEVYSKYYEKMKESNQLDFFTKYDYKIRSF